jgi:crossover junction endodeoxyribonuclease RuvC
MKQVSREDQFDRMWRIFEFFQYMLQKYEITAVAMEKLYFTDQNQNNAEFVYGIRGALAMQFKQQNTPLVEWTPNELKKYITANGNASKELMMKTITKLFDLKDGEIQRHDTADALGLAYLLAQKVIQNPKSIQSC